MTMVQSLLILCWLGDVPPHGKAYMSFSPTLLRRVRWHLSPYRCLLGLACASSQLEPFWEDLVIERINGDVGTSCERRCHTGVRHIYPYRHRRRKVDGMTFKA